MIVSITRASDQEWDTMVDASPTAVYFQTREWFEIWSEYAGFRTDTRLITFDSGKRVLLPLTQQAVLGGLFRINLLAPRGMGGFVTTDDLDESEKSELFLVLTRMKAVFARLNLYDPLSNELSAADSMDSTQVMELDQGFENAYGRWRQDARRQARRGIARGISATPAQSRADWRAYYRIYQETLDRWGPSATNAYDWKLFEIMRSRRSPHVKLWLAWHQGEPIAGALCLYHNSFMVGWHTGRTLHGEDTQDAFHVLQYYIVQDACQRAIKSYDFLGSGGDKGVEKFKSGFGTRFRQVNVYKSPSVKRLTALRETLRRHALTRFLVKGIGS